MENVEEVREWLSSQASKSVFLPDQIAVRSFYLQEMWQSCMKNTKQLKTCLAVPIFRTWTPGELFDLGSFFWIDVVYFKWV